MTLTAKYGTGKYGTSLYDTLELTKTFSVDAVLLKENNLKTFTIDALIKSTSNNPFVGNAILQKTSTKTFSVDAFITNINTKEFSIDAVLKKNDNEKYFLIDGVIQDTSTKTFSADAILYNRFEQELSETLTLTESITRDVSSFLTDDISLVDSVAKKTIIGLEDVVSLNEVIAKKTIKEFDEVILLTDSIAVGIYRTITLTEELALVDSISKYSLREFSEVIALVDSVEVIRVAIPSADITLSDSVISKQTNFLNQMLDDFKLIKLDLPNGSSVTWKRYTRTEDEFGRSSLDTESWSRPVNIVVQPLTEKDREVSVSGEQINSYMKAYCEPSFYVDGTFGVQGIKTGDFITYKTKQYLVEKVAGKFGGSDEVFRKVIMKAVDND